MRINDITMREATFNFLPFKKARIKEEEKKSGDITINTKWNTFIPSPRYIRDHALDGKYIKFFVDIPKKALAWKVLRENELADMSDYKQIKGSKIGAFQLSIKPILDLYKFKVPMKFKDLKVKTYNTSYLEGQMYYVKLDKGVEIK
tara:strand:+ start:365 stop:802 length:438 start_codon:yes stop_codon:yes gene_type:complete